MAAGEAGVRGVAAAKIAIMEGSTPEELVVTMEVLSGS